MIVEKRIGKGMRWAELEWRGDGGREWGEQVVVGGVSQRACGMTCKGDGMEVCWVGAVGGHAVG